MELYAEARAQNARLLRLLTVLEDTIRTHPDERRALLDKAGMELQASVHLRREHLYPLIARYDGLDALTQALERERGEMLRTFERLRQIPPDGSEFQLLIELVNGQARALAEREERELFPLAAHAVPPEQAARVAQAHLENCA
ncbi:MAG TPA: hemerythrin domain-containing protein [Polyangiaceae bacterium]|nr:hemerythrin domain-containing protein [Polyangiaceae bacterium]